LWIHQNLLKGLRWWKNAQGRKPTAEDLQWGMVACEFPIKYRCATPWMTLTLCSSILSRNRYKNKANTLRQPKNFKNFKASNLKEIFG
jgi:hypothetical protein